MIQHQPISNLRTPKIINPIGNLLTYFTTNSFAECRYVDDKTINQLGIIGEFLMIDRRTLREFVDWE